MGRIAASLTAAALLASSAAFAQAAVPPGAFVAEERLKAVRLMAGATGVTNGFYCAYGYTLSHCSSAYYYDAVPFTFGGEVEFGGRGFAIAAGVYDLNAWYNNANKNFVEPIIDLVLRLGTYNGGAIFRARFGAGMYIGPNGNVGWVGRGGFGFTVRGRGPWGFATEIGYEAGSFESNTISTARITVGPEFAF